MQGAAWKLFALAASLVVGFLVLVQAQQNLDKQSLAKQNQTPIENILDEENAASSDSISTGESGDFAEFEQEIPDAPPHQGDDFAHSEPDSSSAPAQNETVETPGQNDPFANFMRQQQPPQQDLAQHTPDSAPQEPNRLPHLVETMTPALQQVTGELAGKVDESINQANAEVDQWESNIVQTAHELQADVQNAAAPLAENAQQITQAVHEMLPVEETSEANSAAMQLVQFTQRVKNQPASGDAPPPLLEAPQSAAPVKEASAEPLPQVNAGPSGFPAMAKQPAPVKEPASEEKTDSENLPAVQPNPFQFAPAAESPEESKPVINPGFPAMAAPQPAEVNVQITPMQDPEAESKPELALEGNEQPAPAAAPTAKPEPRPFFDAEPSEAMATSNPDDPYRLVPEADADAGSGAGMPQLNPEQLSPIPAQPEVFGSTESAPAEESGPNAIAVQPLPAAEEMNGPAEAKPDPFAGFQPAPVDPTMTPDTPQQPAPFATFSPEPAAEPVPEAQPEMNNPQPSSPFPAASFAAETEQPVPETEAPDSAAPAPSFGPEPTPANAENNQPAEPAPFSFGPMEAAAEPKPEPKPEPQPAPEMRPEPAPFSFTDTAVENEDPPAEPKPIKPAPMEVQPTPEVARSNEQEELIGSARVDEAVAEQVLQPKVELFKSAPDNAVLGQPLIYSIEIENTGEVAVNDVVVEDKFPAGTKLTGTIPRAELFEKTLVWKFESLKPSERKKILVRVVPIEPGKIGSVSTVSYKSTMSAQTMVTAPKLQIDLTASDEVAVGETVALKFVISNVGKGEARDVILRNLIPAGLEHPAGADLEYEVGSLNGGERKEVNLTVQARKIGPQQNIASVTSAGGISAEVAAEIQVIESVMSVKRSGPTRRFVGHGAKYQTEVRNNSKRTLQNVLITEKLPEGFEFVSASDNGQFDRVLRTVTWTVPQLEGQQAVEVSTELTPRAVGMMPVQIKAQDQSGHQAVVNSEIKVEGFASLAVRIPDTRGPVARGERVSMRFKVVNRGSAMATQVKVNCNVPRQLTYVSANGPVEAIQTGNIISFTPIAQIAPNGEATFDVVFSGNETGDGRVEFEVKADQITTPIKHEEQVIVYGE